VNGPQVTALALLLANAEEQFAERRREVRLIVND
jgi:hypothetical protein